MNTRQIPTSSEPPLRISLLGAGFETGNMGVGALTAGAIRCILQQHPNAEIFLLDYSRQKAVYPLRIEGREIEVPLVNIRFSKKLFLSNNVFLLVALAAVLRCVPAFLRRKVVMKNETLRHIHDADVIGSIAGGDSFSDIYGMGRLVYIALPQILALLCQKNVVQLPQTFGPFQGKAARLVARYILNGSSRIYSRDLQGMTTCKELGVRAAEKKVRFCYDMGFALEPTPPLNIDIVGLPQGLHTPSLAGFNVSGLLWMGGYSRKNMFGLKVDYKALVAKIVHQLVAEGASVLLVPHVFAADAEGDPQACEQIYENLKGKYAGRIGWLRGRYNQGEIKYIIGKCGFFSGSRMHACIAAISQCVPTVCIAYSDKFAGVMEPLGVQAIVADPRGQTEDEILAVMARVYAQKEQLAGQLRHKMPEVAAVLSNLFHEITPGQPLGSGTEAPAHSSPYAVHD